MKITKQQLKQIIMEELEVALSEEGLDMSKLHKPTSLPAKSEEDDSEELPEAFDPSKMKAPEAFKGDEDAARKRATSSVVQ